ncbi:MAG: hypothetical protein ACTTJV_08890, partial [Ottowia sp.]
CRRNSLERRAAGRAQETRAGLMGDARGALFAGANSDPQENASIARFQGLYCYQSRSEKA